MIGWFNRVLNEEILVCRDIDNRNCLYNLKYLKDRKENGMW